MGSWILLAIVIAVALLWGLPRVFRWRRDRDAGGPCCGVSKQERGSRVITLIHRQEGSALFGLPFGRYIDIDDSEQLLRAIRMTRPSMPIDLLLHTPGGLVLASDQIAHALKRHAGKVTVIVPHYAMSGGTLVALAADEIAHGPGRRARARRPAARQPDARLVAGGDDPEGARAGQPEPRRRDAHPRRRRAQGHRPGARRRSRSCWPDRVDDAEAERLATLLSEGRWTHDYPIRLEEARELGLPVSDAVPELVYQLMELYPRRSQRRPSVEFIPTPYRTRSRDE